MTIYKFEELVDLKNIIKEDLSNFNISANRFPIRFIFLNSYEELKDIISLLFGQVNIVELSSFLYNDDGFLGVDQVIKEINNLKDNSIIVPFSEFIRFLKDEDFFKILKALAEIENTNFRLYIPLVGLWDRFEDLFWSKFYRKDNWAPIWKLNSPIKLIKIYQIDFHFDKEINLNNFKLVSNTREWLDLWKNDGANQIISLSKLLRSNFKYSLPDQSFSQDFINNPKEYLYKIFDMDVDSEYNSSEEEYWIKLLIEVSKINKKNLSLKNIFTKEFNINNFSELSSEECLQKYLDSTDSSYHQWLIKNTFIESPYFSDSYLAHCFKKMTKLNNINLARTIFLEIFNLEYSECFLDERRLLLKHLDKANLSFAENTFDKHFKNIEHLTCKQQFNYLTTSTFAEKLKIMKFIQNMNLENLISELKIIFPELYYYLDWNLYLNDEIPDWILDYFKEYNKSKVINNKSKILESLLNEKNNPNNFYKWYFDVQNNFNIQNDEKFIVWIDGLGAEWLPLLTHYLNFYGKKNNKKVKYKSIKAVNLPSATEFNKFDCDKKISTLDDYIHKNHYNYPKSLFDEMDYIKSIAINIVKIDAPRITIVSDHGFTFLCTKEFGGRKKYQFHNSKHKGRYVSWENKEDVFNDDYMSTKCECSLHQNQKYLVSLRHISLYNTPSHEVHGGATPEEILVPSIILENDENVLIDYDIQLYKDEINVSKDLDLPITIYPDPLHIPIVICNNKSLLISKDQNQYIIKLDEDLKQGTQNITIKIDDEEIKTFEVNIKKGGMEEEDYGTLFR